MIKEMGIPVLFIPLTKGEKSIVDANRDDLLEHKWSLSHYGYAVRGVPGKQGGIIYLHREIMNAQPGQDVDHINGNKLDNTTVNLRLCTRQQNLANKPPRKDSKLQVKGVRITPSGKYEARINHKTLGTFDTPSAAATVYANAAIKLHGEFAFKGEIL